MKIVIAGGSGLVGRALTRKLGSEHDVVILSRDPSTVREGRGVRWDPASRGDWSGEVATADAIVNLAGAGIADGRWTEHRKRLIRESRLVATGAISDVLLSSPNPKRTFVSASAVGYYGSRGDEEIDEESASGDDYLATVCVEWESAAMRADGAARVVLLRIGIVLSTEGGALAKMLPAFRMCVGGRLGSGEQWMSWIHIDDVVGMIEWAIANSAVMGAVNATAPDAVTNSAFTNALSRTISRPAFLPAPAFALRLALGEMAGPLLLTGQRVVPKRTLALGYRFIQPSLDGALRSLLD